MNVNTLVLSTLAGARPLGMRGEPLHVAHDQIRGAIRRRLGARYARLLAEPLPYDGGRAIDWYTETSGLVIPFADLPATRQEALLSEIDGLLGDIEALARRFDESGSEDGRLLGQALRLAVRRPSNDYVFLVGDQPVIACWGYDPEPAASTLPPAFPLPTASDHAAPAEASVAAARGWSSPDPRLPVIVARRETSARPWRAAAMAASFLVVGSAWAFSGFPLASALFPWTASLEPPLPAPTAIAVTEQHVRLTATLAQYRARGEELGLELVSLQEKVRRAEELCRQAPSPPQPTPRGEEARDTSPPAAPVPGTQSATAQACPPARRAGAPAPEISIVIDGAAGMNLPSGFSPPHEEQLATQSKRGDPSAMREIKALIQTPGPKRLDDVKQATTQVIPLLPAEVRVGFVVFDDCRAIQDFGYFGAADRPRLLGLIQSKEARGGTPLARAIETAGSSMRSTDGVIVVFSDGRDSCGGNVCAVAQRLHAAKPGIKIHLIDVAGSAGDSTCLATITGGRIYSATSAQAATDALTAATSAFQPPPHCKARN